MIFVVVAYESLRGHTAGFLGLQIVLLLVAIMNTTQVLYTGQSYPTWNLSETTTKWLATVYLSVNYIVSFFKLWATIEIVVDGSPVGWSSRLLFGSEGFNGGQLVDYIWMFMNAILPIFIAWVRMTDEDPLTIKFAMPPNTYAAAPDPAGDDDDDES